MKKLSTIAFCMCLLSACTLNLPDPIADMGYENIKKGPFIKYDKYSVYSDNNNDGIINKGETVQLKISLKNIGNSAAKSVKATFSATSSYVSAFSPTAQITYGDISAGGVKWAGSYGYTSTSENGVSYYTIQFAVSFSAPVGTQIPISINITDESNNTWKESFNVTVEAAKVQVAYNSYSVYYDNNSDGIINKGETVQLRISLKNTGTSLAKAVKATFSTTSTYVSALSPTTQITYGDISTSGVKWAGYNSSGYSSNSTSENGVSYTIQFTISSSTPAGTQIPISINITDESNNTWKDTFNVTVEATKVQVAYNSHSIYSDSNNDGIVNKGETVQLKISLKNTGTSAAKAVKATFSTTSSYVSALSPTAQITYGDISTSGVKWANYSGSNSTSENGVSYYTIQFTVSSSAPAGTQIPISISIVDESNNTWTESFNVTVSATNAQVVYNSHSIYSDSNNDGIVNKGETVQLNISLKNTGTSAAKAVEATFSTTSSYVSAFSPTAQITYGDISAGGVKWADSYGYTSTSENGVYCTIRFTVSTSAPAGTQIPISISIVDESNNTWMESFNVTVSATNAQIVYDKYSVSSDNNSYSGNNGDGIINKGETIGLRVWLKNTGTSTAKGVKATFATTGTYVSSIMPTTQLTYGDITAGSSVVAYYNYYSYSYNWTILFDVSFSAPAGTQIPISISIVDESNNTWTQSFNVAVQ